MSRQRVRRLDDLIIGGYRLWQDPDSVCFGIDAIALGHFARIRPQWRYGDLGTGTGAIAHILVGRGATDVVAFEIQEELADLCGDSIEYNQLAAKLRLVRGDYRTAYREGWTGQFHGLVVNPPYFPMGQGTPCVGATQRVARHDGETTLYEVASTAMRLLRHGGLLWLIYRSDQLAYVMECLEKAHLAVKRLRFIHAQAGRPSKLVLIEARLGGAREGLMVEPPLYFYECTGVYTKEVRAWYEKR